MIKIDKLCKKYDKKKVIDNLNCVFLEKGITVIVGMNGCGKTTLLNIITNLLEPDSGMIYMNDLKPDMKAYKSQLFYVPSDFFLPEYMTGLEYCHFILSRYTTGDKDKLQCILSLLDLKKEQTNLIETYSFGMKKKLQIALAIACDVKYMIFDEIFSGLDFETTIFVQEVLNLLSHDKKIIIVSHDKDTIERFPHDIMLMQNGTLNSYQGTPNNLYDFIKKEGNFNDKICEFEKHF
ncbi:MAG: ABC transporter ATP-binding protein [Erysipelotrichaceae bacterium]